MRDYNKVLKEVVDKEKREFNKPTERQKETVLKGKVAYCVNLNLREKPSIDSTVKRILQQDSTVIILEETNDKWLYVETQSGIDGYVMKGYIKEV